MDVVMQKKFEMGNDILMLLCTLANVLCLLAECLIDR